MATRRTKRTRQTRKGGGHFTRILELGRSTGVYHRASSSKAAREIINLYAKGYPLDEEGEEKLDGILKGNFTERGRKNILHEVHRISREEPPPKNSMNAYMDLLRIIKGY
jgi:hypothetical protein